MVETIQGALAGQGRRFGIAVARFNDLVSNRLLDGAVGALTRQGVADSDISVAWVPGAFELGLTCRWMAESGRFDAVIALGVVIRGGTAHFDYVCSQAARGVLDASMATSVPVTFGVLTCDTLDQALERAGSKGGNKGADAAMAALEMAALRSALQGS